MAEDGSPFRAAGCYDGAMKPAMRFSLREVFVVIGMVAVVCWSVGRVRQAEQAFEIKLAEQERLHRLNVEALQQSRARRAAEDRFLRDYRLWSANSVPLGIAWPPLREPKSPLPAAVDSPWELGQQPGP